MRKILTFFLLIVFPTIYYNCGFIDRIYQEPLGFGFVIAFNSIRLNDFERSITCYYKTYNEFPKYENTFEDFVDTTDFSQYKNLVFSKLERDISTNSYLKYDFQLKPYIENTKSDSSKFFIDSIRVDEFIGSLIFSDSLISQNIDSIIVDMKVTSLFATIFIEGDSINYNNESTEVYFKQNNSFANKISLKKSCLK